MTTLIVVAALVAGALGAVLRYGITRAFRESPARLPWAVLLANVLGCFVAGIVVAVSYFEPHGALRLIALGGFAGGLTTFSTFSVETVQLALDGRWRTVIGSVLGNVLGGLAAFAVAWYLTAVPVLLGFVLLR
jgi:CrcB protein